MAGSQSWLDAELTGSTFADERLGKRLRVLLERMGGAVGKSLPMACQDWAATKAAYRFLSNDRVSEAEILAGHFQATRDRFVAHDGPVLVLQDTTEFSFKREGPAAAGFTARADSRKAGGKPQVHTGCGLLMHASLVVTLEGLPLGLAAAKFWTRDKFEGTAALEKKVSPTRMPIEEKESGRWLDSMRRSTALLGRATRCVHVGDRESDIYELFCTAFELGTRFLVRTCVDRRAGAGDHTVADEMAEERVQGVHYVDVRNANGDASVAAVEVKYRRVLVHPPIGKSKHYPPHLLTVIHATERGTPVGRPPIVWKLITNVPVDSPEDAIEKLHWYALRWRIETFHKILKSGCRTEDAKLRTAERLVNLVAVFCILSWRIFWLTMLNREAPKAPAKLALTATELAVLDAIAKRKGRTPPSRATVADILVAIARLGGYLARNSDGPPGNKVLWRGLSKLADITYGATLRLPRALVGN